MKIELTIKVDYLPNWGTFEGVRELLQNAKDAEAEFGAPMNVRVRESKDSAGILCIENEGCTMPYEALLLGHTSKSERSDLIGKFGEGFKLGILALVRAGHTVKIRNGGEVWTPEIVASEKFGGARVLAFDIVGGRKNENRVQIEISGIGADLFRDEIKPRFLWLDKDGRRKDEMVKTDHGTLLLGDRYKGRIFVKGIFVEHKPEAPYGYDLFDCDVDRDRRMVASYDFQWRARSIWSSAMRQRPDLCQTFLGMVEAGAPEAGSIDDYYAARLPDAFKDHAADEFIKRHGKDAVPVANIGESADLEHFGRKGIVVNSSLKSILEQKLGPLTKVKEDLKTEVTRTYSWHELTEEQRANVTRAVKLVSAVTRCSLEELSICDFRSPQLQGLYGADGIKLAARVVANRAECLETLVHEVAHREGGDGEKGHVAAIERIWSAIVENLTTS